MNDRILTDNQTAAIVALIDSRIVELRVDIATETNAVFSKIQSSTKTLALIEDAYEAFCDLEYFNGQIIGLERGRAEIYTIRPDVFQSNKALTDEIVRVRASATRARTAENKALAFRYDGIAKGLRRAKADLANATTH